MAKKVISISLGSSKRDHTAEINILGEDFVIERRGTDGDIQKAIELIRQLDGKVSSFGLGGTDLYLVAGGKKYILRGSMPLVNAAQKTPIVDGSGLKNTLERRAVFYINDKVIPLKGKKSLVTSSVDRFGMAEALEDCGCQMVIGDLIFAFGLDIPLHSVKTVAKIAPFLMPIVSRLPLSLIYPTGKSQEEITPKPLYNKYYNWAEIIAGDFHFIRRHLPPLLENKIIITNTVTTEDVELLRQRKVAVLITTTPEIQGRSFGTNVMEALIVALIGKKADEITPDDYNDILDQIGFVPRIEYLNAAWANNEERL